jgi:hypothetical protein
MRADTPLLTDASRLASQQNVENYSVGVANHINGDLANHVQVVVINKNWVDSAGNSIPNSKRLRLLVTAADGTTVAVVIPIIPFTSGNVGNGPQIVTQPVGGSRKKGTSITFSIVATGQALSYAWRHNQVVIPGAVSAQFVLTNIQLVNAGTYDCAVSNPFGIVVSNPVTLAVTLK